MRETISSDLTFVAKVVIPVVWLAGFALAIIMLFVVGRRLSGAGNPRPAHLKWVVLLVGVAGAVMIYWFCIRLKRVALEATTLYVSNYRQEIAVPLHDIVEVTENRWVDIHPVTVHLSRATEFGNEIVLMPKIRWFAFCSSHPVVAQLRAAASRARASTNDAGAP